MFTNQKKDKLIQLRVTEKQKKTVNELADKNDMNVTEFIFMLIEEYYKKNK